ncbi:MAG: hypothetical protein GQ574_18540 [Crocinitomix sp.]|nr:hypothetical protein [Crocinitomix sp.]
MKKVFITLTLALSFTAYSQELTPVYEDSLTEGSLTRVSSFNYYSSNAFNNALLDKFLFGGAITTDIKDQVTNGLKRVNSFGAEAEQSIEHYNASINPIGNPKFGFMASFSDNHFVSANLSSDLFHTIFYGNADRIEDTLDFSFSHVQYMHFQKIGFGVFDKNTLSSIRINYVSGSKQTQARLSNSYMYSADDSIAVMLQGAGFRTDLTSPYFAMQGHGFAIDLNYNFMFETKKGNSQIINLKISNLGLIAWNNQTNNFSIDSLSNYTGFDIKDFINQPEDAPSKEYNFIDTLGLHQEKGSIVSTLPIEFAIQKMPMRNCDKKLQAILGFKAILTSDYFPYLFGGVYYAPTDNFSASTRLSYGGFGGLQWGIDANFWVKDKVYIGLGTFDMIGNISKKYGFGRSINLSAHFKF